MGTANKKVICLNFYLNLPRELTVCQVLNHPFFFFDRVNRPSVKKRQLTLKQLLLYDEHKKTKLV